MKKFRLWLIGRFLPAYAKETVLRENQQLKAEIDRLKAAINERDAYIDGLERGIRAQRRIIIKTGADK